MKVLGLNPPSRFSGNVARDLLWGCWCKGRRIAGVQFPSLPLMYVATVLKEDGHDVDVIDAQAQGLTLPQVQEQIHKYDAVFLISATMSFAEDAEVLATLKERNPRLLTIVFGSHATFLPESALKSASIDVIVLKEAEFVIRDLLRSFPKGSSEWQKTPGIGFRRDGKPVINPEYPYILNLDELPIPDRSFLPPGVSYFNPIVKHNEWTTALSSRGCPSRCTFCTAPGYYGPMYRTRSAQNVVKELEYLSSLGFKEVFYRDELFTVDKQRVFEICRLIKEKNLKISWICSVKASTAKRDLLVAMKEAGCHMIRVGVESGVQSILNTVRKDVKISQIEDTFRWANEIDLETHAHMMLGMPGETEETIKQTFAFIEKINPTTITYGIMTPYPGTEIYDEVLKADPTLGDGTSLSAKTLHTDATYSKIFTSVDRAKIEAAVKEGYRRFYMRPSYILKKFSKVRSLDDFNRLVFAGSNVFGFVVKGDE